MATSVRWLGHAGFLVSSPRGKTILIDPWLTDNPISPVKVEDVKSADIVLVTHDHFDHAGDIVQIARNTGATVVAQPETEGRFRGELGLPESQILYGIGMNIGGSVTLDGIVVTMVQALHSSSTGGTCGYVVQMEDGTTIYRSGDTGIFASMRLIGELYPLDLALLPIGSVFTMDSRQAAKAVSLLNPKRVIPMHYKTFPILAQSADDFVSLVQQETPEVEAVVLTPGQEYAW